MYTFKEYIQLNEQLGRIGGLIADYLKKTPRPGIITRKIPKPEVNPGFGSSSLYRGMAKNPEFDQADEILDMIRIAANTAYNSMGTIFAELLEFYPSAFEAFRVMMRAIMALDVPVNTDVAGNLLDYLFDMDVSLTWDADLNRIFFQHSDPMVTSTLNQYMGQFLAATEGLMETLIEVLESGDSMYG